MLSTMTMIRLGYVTGNRMTNLQARNIKLQKRAIAILESECHIDEPTAQAALASAGWSLPLAIVMTKTGADKEPAEQALQKAGFVIGRAVELLKFKDSV